jgi:hypothetical protein
MCLALLLLLLLKVPGLAQLLHRLQQLQLMLLHSWRFGPTTGLHQQLAAIVDSCAAAAAAVACHRQQQLPAALLAA